MNKCKFKVGDILIIEKGSYTFIDSPGDGGFVTILCLREELTIVEEKNNHRIRVKLLQSGVFQNPSSLEIVTSGEIADSTGSIYFEPNSNELSSMCKKVDSKLVKVLYL